MKDLKKNSIHIVGSAVVYWPQYRKEAIVDVTEIAAEHNHAYCVNNSVICFVHQGEVYVTPFTEKAIITLWEAGLNEEYFYVPFSNWDYPKYEKEKWDRLIEAARWAD